MDSRVERACQHHFPQSIMGTIFCTVLYVNLPKKWLLSFNFLWGTQQKRTKECNSHQKAGRRTGKCRLLVMVTKPTHIISQNLFLPATGLLKTGPIDSNLYMVRGLDSPVPAELLVTGELWAGIPSSVGYVSSRLNG